MRKTYYEYIYLNFTSAAKCFCGPTRNQPSTSLEYLNMKLFGFKSHGVQLHSNELL